MTDLAKARKMLGMTQSDVEAATGIDTATLSLYENKVRYPTIKNAKKLAALYGVEWSSFYDDCRAGSEVDAAAGSR